MKFDYYLIMRLIFVRHGESQKNIGEIFDKGDVQIDELTQKGRDEVLHLTKFLKSIIGESDSCVFLSGSRKRVIQTTQEIASAFSSRYEILENLIPMNAGVLAGLSYDEAVNKFPETMELRKQFVENKISGYDVQFPEGDLYSDYEINIASILKNIICQYHSFEVAVIITHRSVILAVLNIFNKKLNKQPENVYINYPIGNGFVLESEYTNESLKSIKSFGVISNWGNSLVM